MVARAENLRGTTVEPVLRQALGAIAKSVKDPRVAPFLEELFADMQAHLDLFGVKAGDDGDPLLRYRVNVVVDSSGAKGRPVIIETEPSYNNLFGTVAAKTCSPPPTTCASAQARSCAPTAVFWR
jgi:hypothetical protein